MKIVRFQSSYEEPYPLQAVGEASYREEIEEVTGYMGEEEGINADDFIAHLILDDRNPVAPGVAVAVDIDGKTVGYLSTPNAKIYRAKLTELGLLDVVGECSASIKGGFTKKDLSIADFGVRLDIDLDNLKLQPTTILPQRPLQTVIPSVPVAQPQPTPASSKPAQKNAAKIPFIPMKGKGWLYYLFVLPIVASLNLLILFIAGIWLATKWLAERLANTVKK